MNGFIGANIERLDHFITPTLVEDRPDIAIIHIGSSDVTHDIVDQIDVKEYFFEEHLQTAVSEREALILY